MKEITGSTSLLLQVSKYMSARDMVSRIVLYAPLNGGMPTSGFNVVSGWLTRAYPPGTVPV
nr:hypothetical protein [Candidatus Sigynarchaeota archaeon]